MIVAQISDPHIRAEGKRAYGRVDTAQHLANCIAALNGLDPRPDIVVLTGDLVHAGGPAEYANLARLLAPLDIPLYVITGNHDDRDQMRAIFGGQGYLPMDGAFLHYTVEDYRLRLVALDTLVPGKGGGELCAARLDWLDARLGEQPDRPTLVLMHHPPFRTGLFYMDLQGLKDREAFAAVIARHPQVERILCGHLHRSIQARVGGTLASTAPATGHQFALDLRRIDFGSFVMEPPGYQLHVWDDESGLISHTAVVGPYDGPYPFERGRR